MRHSLDLQALAALAREELKTLWQAELGSVAPKRISRLMIARMLTNERQWIASGQSKQTYQKKLKRLLASRQKDQPVAKPGARLIREWNGRKHTVDVLPDGYLWNGKTWRSLSAIAKEITGTKWSGPRFFGVAR